MPRFEFWHTKTDLIAWSFTQPPNVGDEIVLGERGVFAVVASNQQHSSDIAAAFDVEFVREANIDEVAQSWRDLHDSWLR